MSFADLLVDLLLDLRDDDVLAVLGSQLGLDVLNDGADLGLGDPGSLDAHRRGGTGAQVEGVALAGEGLGPFWSRMTRESSWEAVAKARREGTLDLMRPVTTWATGRWVARTRWIPAARASW